MRKERGKWNEERREKEGDISVRRFQNAEWGDKRRRRGKKKMHPVIAHVQWECVGYLSCLNGQVSSFGHASSYLLHGY